MGVIKVGDKVKIKAAVGFERVGYDKTFSEESDEALKTHSTEIEEFVNKVFPRPRYSFEESYIRKRVKEKVAGAIAYGCIANKCKVGGTRRLFLKPISDIYQYKGCVGTVLKTKIVKTMKWVAARSSYNAYNGDYDYNPCEFSNCRTYKVLTVDLDFDTIQILEMHVEKV